MATILLTGMHGTVAPALACELRSRRHAVTAWDRAQVSPDDHEAARAFLDRVRPSAIVHCAMGSPEWGAWMARTCTEMGITFLFTGSASVYGKHQTGPFNPDHVPEPDDDYGRYKLDCEQRIRMANSKVLVVRLGWQMALREGGNQMVDYLCRKHAEHGHIAASTAWFPACSFLHDTARMLTDVLLRFEPGTYLLDSNPGLNFLQIVTSLDRAMSAGWTIRATEDFRYNNLMRDDRLPRMDLPLC
jgi:dTDP-4-dehydrorhamnose reductase